MEQIQARPPGTKLAGATNRTSKMDSQKVTALPSGSQVESHNSKKKKSVTVADIRLCADFFENRAIHLLDDGSPLGGLLRLWLHAADRHHDGNLGDMNIEDIEHAARWGRRRGQRRGAFVALLIEAHLLDVISNDDGSTSYILLDWAEWQPYASRKEERIENARAGGEAAKAARLRAQGEQDQSTKATDSDQKNYAKNEKDRADTTSKNAPSGATSGTPVLTTPFHTQSIPEEDQSRTSKTNKDPDPNPKNVREYSSGNGSGANPDSRILSGMNGSTSTNGNGSVHTASDAVGERCANLMRLIEATHTEVEKFQHHFGAPVDFIAGHDGRYQVAVEALERKLRKQQEGSYAPMAPIGNA